MWVHLGTWKMSILLLTLRFLLFHLCHFFLFPYFLSHLFLLPDWNLQNLFTVFQCHCLVILAIIFSVFLCHLPPSPLFPVLVRFLPCFFCLRASPTHPSINPTTQSQGLKSLPDWRLGAVDICNRKTCCLEAVLEWDNNQNPKLLLTSIIKRVILCTFRLS